jgi:hypothetical protein
MFFVIIILSKWHICVKEDLQETHRMMCNFSEFFDMVQHASILQVEI